MQKAMNEAIEPLKMNLQFFADGDGDASGDSDADQGDNDQDGEGNKTPEEIALEKKIEAESDRKLDSAKKKWEKDQEDKVQKAVQAALEEKERLSKLSEKERKDEETSKREQAIEEREKALARKELLADAVSDMSSKNLPTSFAETLLGESAEKTLENINSFKTAFDEAVNAKVKEALRQDTPPLGGGKSKDANPIAQFRNQQEKQENKAPDLWAK